MTNPAQPNPNDPIRVYHANKHGGSMIHGPVPNPAFADDPTQPETITYKLGPGESLVVPRFIADLWGSHSHYGSPICTTQEEAVSPVQDKLKAERDALAEENKELSENTVALTARLESMQKMIDDLRAGQTPTPAGTPPSPEEIAADKQAAAAAPTTIPAPKTAKKGRSID